MNINITPYSQNTQNTTFKGYDARPLKGLVMSINDSNSDTFEIINQMNKIGKKEGFKIYFANTKNKIITSLKQIQKHFEEGNNYLLSPWAQDCATLTPKNTILTDSIIGNNSLAEQISKITNSQTPIIQKNFIQGGNLFIVKNRKENEILIGANESNKTDIKHIQESFGISKVHIIPQSDYHLDLFIRPLNNKRILVADDKLTIKELSKAIKNIKKELSSPTISEADKNALSEIQTNLSKLLKEFKTDVKINKNPNADEIVKTLKNKGFEPIRIPGRLYYTIPNSKQDDLVYSMNYLNSIVHELKDKSLVYITNKTDYNEKFGITPEISKRINFDFEKILIDSLSGIIKKEDIHFIEGKNNKISELLTEQGGGIHCLCAEILE